MHKVHVLYVRTYMYMYSTVYMQSVAYSVQTFMYCTIYSTYAHAQLTALEASPSDTYCAPSPSAWPGVTGTKVAAWLPVGGADWAEPPDLVF